MTDQPPTKKKGRPATGKRGNFTFRVTEALRTRLEEEAKAAHKSISEVIEERLAHSFQKDDWSRMIDPQTQKLGDLITITLALHKAVGRDDERSTEDINRYACKRAQLTMADAMGITKLQDILDENQKKRATLIEYIASEDDRVEEERKRRLYGNGGGIFDMFLTEYGSEANKLGKDSDNSTAPDAEPDSKA